jgi:putative tryptophan/tyrosine transport system substrate-binding protein
MLRKCLQCGHSLRPEIASMPVSGSIKALVLAVTMSCPEPGGAYEAAGFSRWIERCRGGVAVVVRAQQPAMPVIGFLSARSLEESAHLVAAFRQGLAEQGVVEGKGAAIEYRWADGHYDRLPEQAAEFARRPVAMLVAVGGDMTARAAISATRTIPIVAVFIGDPVASGLVASLNRPGGNVTGISNLNAVIESKRLGLLRELVPQADTVAALQNPDSPTAASQRRDLEEAARAIGLQVRFWQASTDHELEAAFEAMAKNRIAALHVGADAFLAAARNRLAQLAARYALPAIYSLRDVPLAGGLMSYGVDLHDTYRLVSVYAGRIIKGERPVDLPIVQPTKFQFVLNMKTAKALQLAVRLACSRSPMR